MIQVIKPVTISFILALHICSVMHEANAAITAQSIEGHGPAPGCQLTAGKQQQLIQSLCRITGFNHLRFTAEGRLIVENETAITGGSATARRALLEATHSHMVFIIEDRSRAAHIHFGQLSEGLLYENMLTNTRLTIWQVRLDFTDFIEMQAPPEVRAAFDTGFTLLHELLHGLGLKDTDQPGEIGQCEVMVNQMRAELGLPERAQYHGEPRRLAAGLMTVRLRFIKRTPFTVPEPYTKRKQRKILNLYFLVRTKPSWDPDRYRALIGAGREQAFAPCSR